MKKLAFLILIAMFIGSSSSLEAYTKVLNSSNEYGGKTILTIYGPEDFEFKIKQKTEYLDQQGTVRKVVASRLLNDHNPLRIDTATELYSPEGTLLSIEINLTKEKAAETGYFKVITSYSPKGIKTKQEFFYNESQFEFHLYQRSVDYFSVVGEKTRSEFYLTDRETKKTGFYKLITYYQNGKISKQEMYDKEGIVF